MKKKARNAVLLAALLGALPGASAEERATLSLAAGLDYSSGKYGAAIATNIVLVPIVAKYEYGPVTLRATLPWLHISGPGNVVGADRLTVNSAAGATRRSASGIGDVVTGAALTVIERGGYSIDLNGKVKLATADETRGLGTGRNDFSLQVDGYRRIDALTLFATVGRKWLGDPPGTDFRDPWFGSIGGTWRLDASNTVGVSYDARERVSASGHPLSELTAFYTHRFGPRLRVQFYGLVGLSKGSPDYGGGILATVGF